MEPKKNFATTESTSTDASTLDLDPPVGQRVRDPQAQSLDWRRRLQSCLPSESSPQAPSPCATREIPGEECALQRFIVWAAVKRNKSDRMAASDRLKCPLLLCGEQFDDHETMLRHLTKCQHLKTGEYVCYDCMKIERFNDGKCRCCQGQPTKRRRIINMARNFFSNIGNRSRRNVSQSDFLDDVTMPPPSYDSLVIDVEEQSERQQQQQLHHHQHQQNEEQQRQRPPIQPQIELNGTEIHELDSRQMLPRAELDSANYETQLVDYSMTSDRQRNTTPTVMTHSQTDVFLDPREHLSRHPMQQLHKDDSMPPPDLIGPASGGRRPSLALDTRIDRYRNVPRTKHLSPSSSLRSTQSSQNISPVTPWSAGSNVSGVWTMNSSIDTAMTSPITPWSPIEPSAASLREDVFGTTKASTACPDDKCNYMMGDMPELPGDDSLCIPRGLSDPLFFSFEPKDNYSWMQSVDTELSLATSVNMMFTDSDPKPVGIPSRFLEPSDRNPDARMLVESAWDALQEHVSSSLLKLSHVQGNPLVARFRAQSIKNIALTGLSALRTLLQGNDLADPLDYICFIHLIYAFSLVIHENELSARSDSLFQQALAYRRLLNPTQLEYYTQIVTIVWQPALEEQSQDFRRAHEGGPSSSKGKEPEYRTDSRINRDNDILVAVGQNFLDDIESSVITNTQRPIEVLTSDLWTTHLIDLRPESLQDNAFIVSVEFIVRDLSSIFHHSEILSSKLSEIAQKVRVKSIITVRSLELALLQAGKACLDSSDLFDKFIPQVRRLCDPIYQGQGSHSRARYQTLGISLVETLVQAIVQAIAPDVQQTQEDPTAFPQLALSDSYDFLFGEAGEFLANLDASTSQQSQPELANTQDYSSAASSIALQDINSVQQSAIAPKSFTESTSHIGTPNESLTESPILSRPTTVPTRLKPSPPAHGHPSPKPMSSTSQKVEANDSCEICGYRPKGDPQWFKGSMAKHKKMQHSAGPPIIYKCPFPGCTSQYKNRQDNLRQHQIEKNHFVGDEAGRRPSKRKKVSTN